MAYGRGKERVRESERAQPLHFASVTPPCSRIAEVQGVTPPGRAACGGGPAEQENYLEDIRGCTLLPPLCYAMGPRAALPPPKTCQLRKEAGNIADHIWRCKALDCKRKEIDRHLAEINPYDFPQPIRHGIAPGMKANPHKIFWRSHTKGTTNPNFEIMKLKNVLARSPTVS